MVNFDRKGLKSSWLGSKGSDRKTVADTNPKIRDDDGPFSSPTSHHQNSRKTNASLAFSLAALLPNCGPMS